MNYHQETRSKYDFVGQIIWWSVWIFLNIWRYWLNQFIICVSIIFCCLYPTNDYLFKVRGITILLISLNPIWWNKMSTNTEKIRNKWISSLCTISFAFNHSTKNFLSDTYKQVFFNISCYDYTLIIFSSFSWIKHTTCSLEVTFLTQIWYKKQTRAVYIAYPRYSVYCFLFVFGYFT